MNRGRPLKVGLVLVGLLFSAGIVDGSSFVTSGRNQPTCTIQALAYRAADHIIRMAKGGSIASSV